MTAVALFGLTLALFTIPPSVHAIAATGEPSEVADTRIPEFLSKGENIIARENSTIKLECDVKDLGEHVVMWKFASSKSSKIQILYADKHSIQASKYPQISLNPSNSRGITIGRLTADLEGSFICEVSTKDANKLVYTVSMMTSPVIQPTPANGKMTIRKKDHLRLECNISPSPSPATIQWIRNDKEVGGNVTVFEIHSVKSSDEGVYLCKARNEIGESKFVFNVAVEYEPEIYISEKIIHGPIGDNVEVKCEVKANPRARITWQFSNNSRVSNSNKHQIENHEKYSILRIRNVDLKDYDNYNCNAQNQLGTQTVFFEVTGRPSKPKFESPTDVTDGERYTIKWTLFSQNPITSYDLRIREVDHSTGRRGEWRHYSVTPNNAERGPVRHQSFSFDNLSQFNGYEVDLEAANSMGKTRSEIFHFVAKDANSSPALTGFNIASLCVSLMVLALFN